MTYGEMFTNCFISIFLPTVPVKNLQINKYLATVLCFGVFLLNARILTKF